MPAWAYYTSSAERVQCRAYFARVAVAQLPLSELLRIATSTALARRAFHDLPRLDLQGARIEPANISFWDRGQNNRLEGIVQFEGRTYFVKGINGAGGGYVANTAREAFWLLALNRIGRGPRFRGLVDTGRGTYGIVMEHVQGHLWRRNQLPPQEMLSMGPAQLDFIAAQLDETERVLNANGINAVDPQFLVDAEARLTLIDPGFYELRPPVVASEQNAVRFDLLRVQLDRLRQASSVRCSAEISTRDPGAGLVSICNAWR